MGQKISTRRWKELERAESTKQKEFLSGYTEKFKIEPVSTSDRNVKRGDHLMLYRCGYTHHFLCTKIKRGQIKVIEYGLRNRLWLSKKEALDVLVDLEKLGEVHESSLTFNELEDMEAQKIVWPKKLRRYNAKKTIERAKTREGEKKYNSLTNNCECFVLWCICGLNVSLQVQIWFTWVKEVVKSICAGTREQVIQAGSRKLGSLCLKLFANLADEIAGTIISQHPYLACSIGYAIAALIETGLCIWEINKAFEDKENGVIQNDKELEAKLVEIVAKAILRLGLGTSGSMFGAIYGGIPGSILGGIAGATLANFLGFPVARWCNTENQPQELVKG